MNCYFLSTIQHMKMNVHFFLWSIENCLLYMKIPIDRVKLGDLRACLSSMLKRDY